ncbi:MAG: discoidin domain-containing protein [Planctomycetota bacterium]
MCRRLTCLVFFVAAIGLARSASALVIDSKVVWNTRTEINDLEGGFLEIVEGGHLIANARVDLNGGVDGAGRVIMNGGIFESKIDFKHPDNNTGMPCVVEINAGTFTANQIQSFGFDRLATFEIGGGTLIIESNYDPAGGNWQWNPAEWISQGFLFAKEGYELVVEDLGGGACKITASGGPSPVTASMPNPEDGAIDVPRDVIFSWIPGEFAPANNGHKVYFSENFDDVNDSIGGITVSDNSYSPEQRLELGTSYYWRVDEVNGAPDFTVYPSDIWSFETELVGLPIANVTATASSSTPSQGPASAVVDGSGLTDDLHSTDTQTMWSSAFAAQPTWIQFEFDRIYLLHEMWVWNSNTMLEADIGYGFKDVTIEYSLDDVEYAMLGTTHEFARAPGAEGYAHNTAIDFGGVQAKYVKLTVNANWAPFPFPQFGLSEVRLLHIPMRARKPQPDAGATDVPVDVTVSWRAGRRAAEHKVFVSSDEQTVIDGTAPVVTVAEAGLSPSLDLASTYYWRVDEVNSIETPTTWAGDVWSFSTLDSIVVDDFESYNDIEAGQEGSNLIYETWADGFGSDTNGSAIGYTVPFEPTMETDNVHGGAQSAPMEYNNVGIAISEITRTLPAQDWTSNGITTLSLWFYGDPANIPGQLYVKINGVRGIYDGPANNLTLPSWQMWNIDLASVTTNLQSVTSLAIGVEGLGATGTLLLDDIALYRVAPEPPGE